MDMYKVIIEFCGLQGVFIEDVKQFKKSLRCEIVVRQKEQGLVCHDCSKPIKKIRDWHLKELKGPPLGIYQDVKIKLWQARGICQGCRKKRMSYCPFIHPGCSSLTCGFAEVAGRMMEELTCRGTARLLKANPKTLWTLDQWRMQYMLQFLELPKNLDLSRLCADEVHFKSIRLERKTLFSKTRDIRYITNLICWKESKVLMNAAGRSSESLKNCLNVLSREQLEKVIFVSVDIHDPFIATINELCPNAEICLDRFHVVKKANESFDKVRKKEFKKAKDLARKAGKTHDFVASMLSPVRRFIYFTTELKLLKSEQKKLERLRKQNINISNAMLILDYFHFVMNSTTVKKFRKTLKEWYDLVRQSQLKPFRAFAKLIRRYRPLIENYIKSGLTTGVAEGINNKIKALKRAGYGYTDEFSFRLKILQRCGFLNSNYINTDNFFKSVT